MTKKRREVIESPSGKGRVFRDEKEIAKVNYAIQITQEYLTTSTLTGEGEVEGMKRITGQITVTEGERNLITGEALTLHLADERKWDFFAKSGDPVSGSYSAVNVGGEGLR